MKLIWLVFTFFIPTLLLANEWPLLIHKPILEQSTPPTDGSLKVLVWNILKTKRANWSEDFQSLLSGVDIAMIQEHRYTDKERAMIAANPSYEWQLVTAIVSRGLPSGVGTISRLPQTGVLPLISSAREPVFGTPKSALVSVINYKGQNVMLVNIHAINVVGLATFESHLSEVYDAIKNHIGPMIWAGDFNTWDLGGENQRMQKLLTFTERLGLRHIDLANDERGAHILDHVFVRGLNIANARLVNEVRSSDHQPILFDITSL